MDLGASSMVNCSMGTLGNPFASSGDHGGDPMFEQNMSQGFDFLWFGERRLIRSNLAFPSSSPSCVGSLRGRGEGQLGAQPPGGGVL